MQLEMMPVCTQLSKCFSKPVLESESSPTFAWLISRKMHSASDHTKNMKHELSLLINRQKKHSADTFSSDRKSKTTISLSQNQANRSWSETSVPLSSATSESQELKMLR